MGRILCHKCKTPIIMSKFIHCIKCGKLVCSECAYILKETVRVEDRYWLRTEKGIGRICKKHIKKGE